ncbi:MAG: adenylosuccinate synthetase, partial [Thermus sp.]|nr:adenylosuccinate synthetase [Thermus sp.]
VNGFDGLAITKLDVLSGLEKVKVAVEYLDGARPGEASPEAVRYLELEGWGDLSGVESREDLPPSLRRYLELIEEYTGVPVVLFSTSPRREDTFGAVSWV